MVLTVAVAADIAAPLVLGRHRRSRLVLQVLFTPDLMAVTAKAVLLRAVVAVVARMPPAPAQEVRGEIMARMAATPKTLMAAMLAPTLAEVAVDPPFTVQTDQLAVLAAPEL